jgi:hypothetical protein
MMIEYLIVYLRLLGIEIVITEKIDGEILGITRWSLCFSHSNYNKLLVQEK